MSSAGEYACHSQKCGSQELKDWKGFNCSIGNHMAEHMVAIIQCFHIFCEENKIDLCQFCVSFGVALFPIRTLGKLGGLDRMMHMGAGGHLNSAG
jgi:hypothetical protein